MAPRRFDRRWIYAFALASWLVSISGVFGNSGLIQAYNLSRVRRDMTLQIRALENEKVHLRATLDALERDPFVQELTIRETLGFTRSNELVFEFH